MAQSINAISFTANVKHWLANSNQLKVLHVFDEVCNLMNERREILSIVNAEIGNGPFNLVVEETILFTKHLDVDSQISIEDDKLKVGDLIFSFAYAQTWNPRPDWNKLHKEIASSQRASTLLATTLTQLLITNYQAYIGFDTPLKEYSGLLNHQHLSISRRSVQSLILQFSNSLTNADIPTAKTFASKLSGLGQGLTPSGDDFIMGAMYAACMIHPQEIAKQISEEIANIAIPLTTALSGAWIKSASKGEAGILWHQFFDAMLQRTNLQSPISKILSVGETSGVDALSGFFSVLNGYNLSLREGR